MTNDTLYAEKINSKGIRFSVQRVAIYKYVCEHKVHPTVDTVYTALSPKYPTLSRTTVYNTLHLFSEQNLVQTIKIEDDELRYDANMTPHLHFKCTKCGKVYDIFDTESLPVFNAKCLSLLPHGFAALQIQTNLWGICPDCTQAQNSASANV